MFDGKLLCGKEENYNNICRLCLQFDEFCVDVFNKLKSTTRKYDLPEHIRDHYQININKTDGLPTSICQNCLVFTETVANFCTHVQKCDARLQNNVAIKDNLCSNYKLTKQSSKIEPNNFQYDGLKDFVPDANCVVTIIDPNQEYASSDDEFSMDSDNEYATNISNIITNDFNSKSEAIIRSHISNNNNTTKNALQHTIENNKKTLENLKNSSLCQYCDMAFISKLECTEHEARHDAANPFACNFCPFRANNRTVLISHIKELHDNERPFVCVTCNKGFCRRSDLKKHGIVHTGVKPFTCPVCSKTFSRNTNLTKHIRIHTEIKTHKCDKCPRSFISSGDLIRHHRMHSLNKQFKCGKCQLSFTRRDKLYMHQKTQHPLNQHLLGNASINSIPQQAVFYQLPESSRSESMATSIDSLNNKSAVLTGVHGTSQNSYGLNPRSTNLYIEDSYTQHGKTYPTIPTHKQLKLHICNVCSSTFTRKREWERHQVLHTADRPFSCRFCSKKFNRREKLVRHERSHGDDRAFACDQCNLSFSKQEALDMHIKVHGLENSSVPSTQINPAAGIYNNLISGASRSMGLGFYSEIMQEDGV